MGFGINAAIRSINKIYHLSVIAYLYIPNKLSEVYFKNSTMPLGQFYFIHLLIKQKSLSIPDHEEIHHRGMIRSSVRYLLIFMRHSKLISCKIYPKQWINFP